MNIALWIVQGLMAAMFLMAGMMKLSQPKTKLKEKLGDWVDSLSGSQMKLIGGLEVLGAIGLVLPMVLNILPVLTPLAAIGLALTMAGAFILHLRRKEQDKIGMNVVLFLLLAFIVIGRMSLIPLI